MDAPRASLRAPTAGPVHSPPAGLKLAPAGLQGPEVAQIHTPSRAKCLPGLCNCLAGLPMRRLSLTMGDTPPKALRGVCVCRVARPVSGTPAQGLPPPPTPRVSHCAFCFVRALPGLRSPGENGFSELGGTRPPPARRVRYGSVRSPPSMLKPAVCVCRVARPVSRNRSVGFSPCPSPLGRLKTACIRAGHSVTALSVTLCNGYTLCRIPEKHLRREHGHLPRN